MKNLIRHKRIVYAKINWLHSNPINKIKIIGTKIVFHAIMRVLQQIEFLRFLGQNRIT